MEKYIIEKIELPLIYAQKMKNVKSLNRPEWIEDGEVIGPFFTSVEASKHFGLNYAAAGNSINSGKVYNGYKFFTNGTKEITFKEPNVMGAKQEKMLLRATNKNPHDEESLLYNMEVCGFENISIVKFNGVKSIMQVDCCNVECDEKVINRNYNQLVQNTTLMVPRCDKCKKMYKAYTNGRPKKSECAM
ncbi:hypothetical protein BK727_13125 [Bacillus thuringiensis serovar roskildiensis]|uniref:Uncharacterized protein n=1 Tax=Bacillus thuringiensis serovar sooncheon TaxID=180891 RepID=A0A9Q5X2F6_BACTU|nr:hypothetical protein [Bacillus thuringiensis]OTW70614.1 hypothetical protein BK707_11400 [Bacillus thuringiensis serovar coreanensis]OTX42260.1 hypothetical protein BK724_26080 [Bacillus thuringiensis serovar sooncheon]OTX60277.1 hypothetical protein BK725_01000 [Bacillus thuringiensis serovar guiyangiensis]OTX69143.1 hypothetical protein BK727_13125 [Bacillus thuringiensis serovar roskildiensis]